MHATETTVSDRTRLATRVLILLVGGVVLASPVVAVGSTLTPPQVLAQTVATPLAQGSPTTPAQPNDRPGQATPNVTAAQALAERYAPIAFIKKHAAECSTVGEAYLPMPVEIVFGDPSVTLRRKRSAGESSDPVIKTAPVAQDLAGLDDTYYLDLPGNPRTPGCGYEQWSRKRAAELGLQPTVYARIAAEDGRPGRLVLQYWFYWVFDDFNNTHESDWEMIQVIFSATSVDDALTRDPYQVVFAQHGGGEKADWNSTKLATVDQHPLVYPAAGSHATYYRDEVYLGWGEGGTGFGCDASDPPSEEVTTRVVLLPDDLDPQGAFAWLLFHGRWGQRESWEYNGPLSPTAGNKWVHPVSWADNVRTSSLSLPHSESLGPGTERFFCVISTASGTLMTLLPLNPKFTAAAVIIAIALLFFLASRTWRYVVRASHLYLDHVAICASLSVLLIPVAFIGARLEDQVQSVALGRWIEQTLSGGGLKVILGLGIGNVKQFLLFAVVAPSFIHATHDFLRADAVSVRESWSLAIRRLPTVAMAILWNAVLLLLMSLTIVLIPLAIKRGVQWLYTPHAIVIDGASWREARHVSRAKVKGRWWRTLSMSLLVWLFAGVPGPLLGSLLLIGGYATLKGANLTSTILYAISFGIVTMATTVYYLQMDDPALAKRSWLRVIVRRSARLPAGGTSETPA